jgi:trimethylamine-N-oxide reductase (cytochrome c)
VDKYPLQLLTTHPKYRFHGKSNGVSWMREIYKVKGPDGYEYEPLYMHPSDAQAKGLKDGDIVRVFNDRGQILNGVRTTERLTPGVVWGAYGTWSDPLEPTPGSIDRGGDSNKLTPSRPMSEHHMGWACNSTLVEVEKADLDALAEKYPEGWAGKFATWNKE